MIAGQLLLQSPEEDAFWTFVSLMDSHLRPYFSNNSVQLEVDAQTVLACPFEREQHVVPCGLCEERLALPCLDRPVMNG